MNRQEASKTMTLHTGVDLNTKANTMKKQVIKYLKYRIVVKQLEWMKYYMKL